MGSLTGIRMQRNRNLNPNLYGWRKNMENRHIVGVILLCIMAAISAGCSEKPVESNDSGINPVEIDMTQLGIRHVDEVKHIEIRNALEDYTVANESLVHRVRYGKEIELYD